MLSMCWSPSRLCSVYVCICYLFAGRYPHVREGLDIPQEFLQPRNDVRVSAHLIMVDQPHHSPWDVLVHIVEEVLVDADHFPWSAQPGLSAPDVVIIREVVEEPAPGNLDDLRLPSMLHGAVQRYVISHPNPVR